MVGTFRSSLLTHSPSLSFPPSLPPSLPPPSPPPSRLIRYDEKDLPDSTPKLSRSAQRKLERMQGLGVKLKLPELQEQEGEEEEEGKEEEE